jgi:hypothetical protein
MHFVANKVKAASDAILASLDGLFVGNNKTRWNTYFDALLRMRNFINNNSTELKKVWTF